MVESPKFATAGNSNIIDTTAFNNAGWQIRVAGLSLENCAYRVIEPGKRLPADEFDPSNMAITGIGMEASSISIQGDTLYAQLRDFQGKERCGLEIRTLQAKVTVSPNASLLEDLILKTKYSVVKNSYEMHYSRFPDFKDYINTVRMRSDLEDAIIDPRDIAHFASDFKKYFPAPMHASGQFDGTVADFTMKNFRYPRCGKHSIRQPEHERSA